MIDLFLIIYGLLIWLVFVKFKLLPFNTTAKVIIFAIPVVLIAIVMLVMNVVAPSSEDVRVYNKTVPLKTMVRGRLENVMVEEYAQVHKGDTLFTIQQDPFIARVAGLKASIAKAEASLKSQKQNLQGIHANKRAVKAQLDLARTRREQFNDLVNHGAGNRFDLEQAENNIKTLEAQWAQLLAQESALLINLNAEHEGKQVTLAELYAQLDKAQFDLDQTIVTAPIDGTIANVQVRPGQMALPLQDLMTIIDDYQSVVATFNQNELHQMAVGNEAELTFVSQPGKIVPAEISSIVWASSRGQLLPSGVLPPADQAPQAQGKYIVRFKIMDDSQVAMGANGAVAVYTNDMMPFYIIRKVMIRLSAKLNYLILKAH
ncbi:HlyD family secretion protein [Persicobacter diffluens]|uniref:Multidrug transporter n=1 Tax=Persicobacter diffluens TaxID=981 RepID=A0AAN5ALD4_9BACT|nr:multidrug transporter [Persicobacter diffluens]